MFGVYEDLVFSVAKRVPRRIISGLCGAICRYGAIRGPLVRSPAKTTRRGLGDIVHAAPARRECVVYPDGNSDAVAALSALLAPDTQLTAPDVQVLPADASPALEAALWAASPPRGNRDLQHAVDNKPLPTRRSNTPRPRRS